MIRFELTDEEEKRVTEWLKDKPSFGGAIGGEVTYRFTPTSIGVIVVVVKGKHELDLTDYDSF